MDNSPNTFKTYASNYSSGECQICYDNGLIIPCKICEKEACKTCIRKYIMDGDSDIPKCMFCSCVYHMSTLVDMLGKTFVTGEYTKHVNKIVVKKHKLLLPTFQSQVTNMIEKNRLKNKLYDLRQQIQNLKVEIKQTKGEIDMVDFVSQSTFTEQTRKCSVSDCNGFLDINFKCGICSTFTCPECLEIKLTDHICDEDTKKTVKLLSGDTKNCPKCSFSIFKIEGCDQMYCTICNTAFSWNTGNIDTGRIHNPHYYEYRRRISPDGQIPREEGDGQCGEIVFTWIVQMNNIIDKLIVDYTTSKNMDNINRFIDFFDMYFIKIIEYISTIRNNIEINLSDIDNARGKIRDANINLLMKNIDSAKYDKIIIANNKTQIFANENMLLSTMLVTIVTDSIVKFYQDAEIATMIYDLSRISSTDMVKYVDTCIEYHQKTKIFAETLKNDIVSIAKYYDEEILKINSLYERKSRSVASFHGMPLWNIQNVHTRLLSNLSVNLDNIPPQNHGLRRQEIINRRRIINIMRANTERANARPRNIPTVAPA